MSDAAQTFNEAYDLIEQGNLTAARQLLDTIRAENQNNPDFWWVYAHALEDEQAGREALQQVQLLQPDYPGIDNLLQKARMSVAQTLPTTRPRQSLPDLPNTGSRDDDFGEMDDDDFAVDEPLQGNNRRNMLLLGGAAAVVLFILAAMIIPGLLENETQPTATPLAQAIVPTDEPTATEPLIIPSDEPTATEPLIIPSDEPTATKEIAAPTDEPTAEPNTADGYSELAAQLSDYEVPANGIEVGETLLGNTFLVTTCSTPGPVANQSILNIVNTIKGETLPADITAIGFRIANCADGTVLRIVGVARSSFDDFAADNITAQQLQGMLRPIG
jgi:hypothetical protein